MGQGAGNCTLKKSIQLEMFSNQIPSAATPLSYPGGKCKSIAIIKGLIPNTVTEIVSPFVGGGSIELHQAANGIYIHAYDIFDPLIHFWQTFLRHPNDIIDVVLASYPLVEKSIDLRATYHKINNDIQKAAAYWIINKTTFSALGFNRAKGTTQRRIKPKFFQRFYNFYNPNISFKQSNFRESLNNHSHCFAYCDPPYVGKEDLYQYGNRDRFPHEELNDILLHRDAQWILSYGEHPLILDLYSSCRILRFKWNYTLRKKQQADELLICNF